MKYGENDEFIEIKIILAYIQHVKDSDNSMTAK
jgi:hypothetical protein